MLELCRRVKTNCHFQLYVRVRLENVEQLHEARK